MQIKSSVWFGKIGIVIGVEVVTKERKAYIGTGNGLNQRIDEQFIAEYGMPFSIKAAELLVGAK